MNKTGWWKLKLQPEFYLQSILAIVVFSFPDFLEKWMSNISPNVSQSYFSCDCCPSIFYLLPLLAQQWLFIAPWIKPNTLSQCTKPYRAWTFFFLPFRPHFYPCPHWSQYAPATTVIFLFFNTPSPFPPQGLYLRSFSLENS